MVTVHDPIVSHQGNLNNALYGSFLPVPPDSAFPPLDDDDDAHAAENAPGALVLLKDDIIINKGKERTKLKVTNKGDRPVQVNSATVRRVVITFDGVHSRRLGPITTSSKRTRTSALTDYSLMESDSTYHPVLPYDLNPETARLSHLSQSPVHRSSGVETAW